MVITQALSLLSGLIAAVLAGVFLLIARFYERTSGEPSGYVLFALPALLLFAASGRETWAGPGGSDAWTNGLRLAGGALLFVLCHRLFNRMTARQRK